MNPGTKQSNQLLLWTHRAGILEGISYVVLLFIAMPLKYGLGFPQAVRLTGSAHGLLFVVFIGMLYYAWQTASIDRKTFIRAIILSFVPFGTFFLSFDKSVN
jgi:integral membrane protein